MVKTIIIPHEFEILDEIGNGYYGKVYKIKDTWNDNILATKIININDLVTKMNKTKEDIKQSIENEISIMKKIKNQFSCEFLGKANDKENYYIFMKLYDTDLQTFLKKNYANGMKIDELKRSLSQLNVAFRKMYENNIVHRDIKPNNILIEYINDKRDFNVVLSDFGLGKYLNLNDETLTLGIGTNIYMAPEISNMENNYSNKVDLYSLGITILCMLNKKINISEIYTGNIPQTNNTLLDDLLSKMLKINPEERINWNEYFNHEFFLYKDHTNLIENYISKKIDKDNNIIIDNRITIREKIQLIIYGKKNNFDVIKYFEYYANNCPRCDEGYGGYILGVLRRAISKYDGRGSGIICHKCGYCYYFK